MTRITGKLTALQVARAAGKPGMLADGGGLYLKSTAGGASWVLRYMLNGRPRYMGLGPLSLFSLQEARAKALDARRLLHERVDPLEMRRDARLRAKLHEARTKTFRQCAEEYISAQAPGWRNGKHQKQWSATLSQYAHPLIGDLPVQGIDTALVMRVLEQPIDEKSGDRKTSFWIARPETAKRVRGRIEAILNWAKVREYRQGENPARWRGHLENLLPKREKLAKVKHHAALPYDALPDFIRKLREQDGISARALEFAILTAARTGEVIGASWGEIDMQAGVWFVPAERMKSGKEHRVPLTSHALAVLETVRELSAGKEQQAESYAFPGLKDGQPLSNMAFLMLLRRMGRADITAHGFRSTFRDWAAEATNFPGEIAEMCLAHTVGSDVERAYKRTDLFEKRLRLLQMWAEFALPAPNSATEAANVTPLRRA